MAMGVIEGAGKALDARRLRAGTGARVAQLVSAWPWVREVPSTIPGDISSLF